MKIAVFATLVAAASAFGVDKATFGKVRRSQQNASFRDSSEWEVERMPLRGEQHVARAGHAAERWKPRASWHFLGRTSVWLFIVRLAAVLVIFNGSLTLFLKTTCFCFFFLYRIIRLPREPPPPVPPPPSLPPSPPSLPTPVTANRSSMPTAPRATLADRT
jgi:hypothetical protein